MGFPLEDGVLKVLTGSTGVTVLGLVGMVLTGILSAPGSSIANARCYRIRIFI